MIKVISSKDNKIVKSAACLKEVKYRKTSKTFLLEGRKALDVALEQGLVLKVFTVKELDIPFNIEQFIVPIDIIKKISPSVNPEGIISVVKYPTFEDKEYSKCLYLDAIQDPGNMGTIIRSAVSFNFDCIYLSSDSVDIYNEKVIAASKGAVLKIPCITAKFNDIVGKKDAIVSSLDNDSKDIKDLKIKENFVLVLGNEAHGVRKEIASNCTIKVKIPMNNFESLNVAVAAGILMYKLANN